MYHNRVKRTPDERSFYMITNRVTDGSFVFDEPEKAKLRELLFAGEDRFGHVMWDNCIMSNH